MRGGGGVLRDVLRRLGGSVGHDAGLVLAIGRAQPPDGGSLHLVDEPEQLAAVGGADARIGVEGAKELRADYL